MRSGQGSIRLNMEFFLDEEAIELMLEMKAYLVPTFSAPYYY